MSFFSATTFRSLMRRGDTNIESWETQLQMIWFSHLRFIVSMQSRETNTKSEFFDVNNSVQFGGEVFMSWIIWHAYEPKIIDMKRLKNEEKNFPRPQLDKKILHIAYLADKIKMRMPRHCLKVWLPYRRGTWDHQQSNHFDRLTDKKLPQNNEAREEARVMISRK